MIWLLIACRGGDDPVTDAPPAETAVDSQADTQDSDPVEPEAGCADERLPLEGEVCVLESPCTWTGGHSYGYFGMSLDAGDLDGDGRDDLVVGEPGHRPEGLTNAGRVVLLSGTQVDEVSDPPELLSEVSDAYLGNAVAVVGDANGDGVADLLVGQMGLSEGESFEGGAVLVLGGADFGASASWTGPETYGRAGWAVDGADLDGDGLSELIVTGGIRDEDDDVDRGRVYVLKGRESFDDGSLESADTVYVGQGSVEGCGQDLAHGDFDGDGLEDLAIGAPNGAGYDGRVWIVPGGGDESGEVAMATWEHHLDGENTYDAFGYKVAAGDLDGDGVAELIVGAPLNDQADSAAGKVHVFSQGEEIASFTGAWHDFQLGTGVHAGDLDGDGVDELLMGSVNAYRGLVTKGGHTAIATQAELGLDVSVATLGDAVLGGGVKDYSGSQHAIGDFDADGVGDLVVGGGYENHDGAYDVGAVHLFFGD